jgi:phosphonate transport system substrate-binding protein
VDQYRTLPKLLVMTHPLSRRSFLAASVSGFAVVVAACGSDTPAAQPAPIVPGATNAVSTNPVSPETTPETTPDNSQKVLHIGAIPDQDPEKLLKLYGLVSAHLAKELNTKVEFVPVIDYAAAVSLFHAGDLDLVWFGGLTGVQARLATPGAVLIAQRDVDDAFHSVFIANADAGIAPIGDIAGLSVLGGKRFTFGSESSTSGRLMPQYFLDQAGITPDSFDGEAGFSGSHDKTVDLVAAGTYQAGVLNESVWRKRIKAQTVDTTKVVELFVTPGYRDYHWLMNPTVPERFGPGIAESISGAFTGLSLENAEDAAILDLYGAKAFIPTEAANYAQIEEIGRKLGLITE